MYSKMKKIAALFLAFVMVFAAVIPVSALGWGDEWANYDDSKAQKYSDVPVEHWANNAITKASNKNWFGGYPDGTFRPDGSITRAEALKVFVVFLGLELSDVTESSFYDVDPKEWYAPYVEAGKDLFPTHTSIQGKRPFQPNMPVTREDTIYALVNALGCKIGEKYIDLSVLNMFNDKGSISADLKEHFAVALGHGLVSGFPDSTIRAQASLTRAEFATLLLRGTEHGFHDKHEVKITSVKVYPESPVEIEIGESVTLTARATYTSGENKEYTALSPYDALNNGVITLNGTTFTGVKEGTTTIKYNDSYLKNDSLTVIVKKPSDAPEIKVTDYPDVTELNSVAISGFVEDKNIASVDLTCNDKDVRLDDVGNFTTTVSLNVGANEIKFVAVNQYDATAEKTITITRTDVPTLRITNYKEKTTERKTPVSGVIEYHDLSSLKLTCNGSEIDFDDDGKFTTTVELKMGKNLFEFEVKTKSGNTAEQAIVIRRYEIDPDEEKEDPVTPTPIVREEKEVYKWEWEDAFPKTITYNKVEAVLVIDDSGSLGGDYGYDSSTGSFVGGTDPEHKRLEVARAFIDAAHDESKIGIVKFDYNSERMTSGLVACDTAGKAELKNLLKITPSNSWYSNNEGVFDSKGTTYMYEGINDGFGLFESNDPDVMKVMIVFSDGQAHDTERHAETLKAAMDNDVIIYSVGLGSSISSYFEEYMKPLATGTGGSFYLADDADELGDIFEEIIILIDKTTDSDGDGIPNYYEDHIKYENGDPMPMDKDKNDTDGDGRLDGEEIRLEYEYNADGSKVQVTAYMSSDPTKVDTDGDGVNDKDDEYAFNPEK